MSTQTKIIEYYKDLPGWAKGVVIIGGSAIAWFGILNPVRKAIIKKLDAGKLNKSVSEFKGDLADLKRKGINPTYPSSQYFVWADAIENQFSGCDWGVALFDLNIPVVGGWTGSGSLMKGIAEKMNNDADFSSLVLAFGTRTYDQCGFWPFAGNITANLSKAVNDELDSEEIKAINKILQKKNITYRF